MKKNNIFVCISLFSMILCSCKTNIFPWCSSRHKHTPGEPVIENKIDATCTRQGSYDLVVYCKDDHEELSRETKTIEALGHDLIHHEGKSPTLEDIGYEAYDTCSRCDYSTYKELPSLGSYDEIKFDEALEEVREFNDNADNLSDVNIENKQTRHYDVSPNFEFLVESSINEPDAISELITITNNNYENIDFFLKSTGNSIYSVAPINPYEEGDLYTVTIGEGINFCEKLDTIRSFVFNVERSSPNNIEINKNTEIHYFDLSAVIDVSLSEEELVLYTTDPLMLKQGDIFCFSQGNLDNNSIIGSFVLETAVDDKYKVIFEEPDLYEVFSEFDVNLTEEVEFSEEDAFDIRALENEIENSAPCKKMAKALAHTLRNERAGNEFTKNLKVEYKLSYPDKKEALGFLLEGVIKSKIKLSNSEFGSFSTIESALFLHVQFAISMYVKYSVHADAKLRRGWFGIPVGIDATIDVIQDTEQTFKFTIGIGNEFCLIEEVDENFIDKLEESFDKLTSGVIDPNSVLDIQDPVVDVDEGNLYRNLFTKHFPIATYFECIFSVGVEIDFELAINCSLIYHTKQTCVVGSYTTSKGPKNYQSPSEMKASHFSINADGHLNVAIMLRASVDFSVIGLSWLFKLGIFGQAGLYFELDGYCSIEFNSAFSGVETRPNGFFEMEIGLIVEAGVSGSLLFLKFDWELFHYKLPFLSETRGSKVYSYVGTQRNLLINENDFDLEKLGMFDVCSYGLEGQSIVIDSLPHLIKETEGKDAGYSNWKINLNVISGNEYFNIIDNKIVLVDSSLMHWKAKIELAFQFKTEKALIYLYDVEYISSKAVSLKFDDVVDYYEKNKTLELPVLSDTQSKTFLGWTRNSDGYFFEKGSSIIVKENDSFTSVWKDAIYYQVRFFNGFNQLINSQLIRENESAIEPDKALYQIDGYEFIGWDRDFSCITEDIDIYGVYVRIH